MHPTIKTDRDYVTTLEACDIMHCDPLYIHQAWHTICHDRPGKMYLWYRPFVEDMNAVMTNWKEKRTPTVVMEAARLIRSRPKYFMYQSRRQWFTAKEVATKLSLHHGVVMNALHTEELRSDCTVYGERKSIHLIHVSYIQDWMETRVIKNMLHEDGGIRGRQNTVSFYDPKKDQKKAQ